MGSLVMARSTRRSISAAPTSKDKPVCSFSWATLGINCLIMDVPQVVATESTRPKRMAGLTPCPASSTAPFRFNAAETSCSPRSYNT